MRAFAYEQPAHLDDAVALLAEHGPDGVRARKAPLGLRLLDEPPLMLASIGLVSTAIIHAIFFGGARYAIVTMPWTIALAGCVLRRKSVGL